MTPITGCAGRFRSDMARCSREGEVAHADKAYGRIYRGTGDLACVGAKGGKIADSQKRQKIGAPGDRRDGGKTQYRETPPATGCECPAAVDDKADRDANGKSDDIRHDIANSDRHAQEDHGKPDSRIEQSGRDKSRKIARDSLHPAPRLPETATARTFLPEAGRKINNRGKIVRSQL